MKWGHSSIPSKWGQAWLLSAMFVATVARATGPAADFHDDFESHVVGQLPGPPWKEETYNSGAVVVVDSQHAFSGRQAMHVLAPAGADYRRGYVAIHLRNPLPQLQTGFFGRTMVWLDAAPGTADVHWTLLQAEGRSADDRYNSIYRLGLQQRGGTQLMANFETTPPLRTDCRQQSSQTLPVRRWACVEFHFEVATHEMQFWIDGKSVTHVVNRANTADACRANDLGGQWLAPPRFDSLYLGFERYGNTPIDQNLWIDDVALSRQRVGCPAKTK